MLCFSTQFLPAAYLSGERACAYLKQGAGCSERSQKRPSAAAAGDRANAAEKHEKRHDATGAEWRKCFVRAW